MADVAGLQRHPPQPGTLLTGWLDEARQRSGMRNWNAAMLATVGADGRPSVRTVLIKDHDPGEVAVTFFTNYNSRKGRDIEGNPSIALVMHWDELERQIRIEGAASRTSERVSDEYFSTRPRESQIGAWASDQSQPLDSWQTLLDRVLEVGARYIDQPIPRPPHWGGYLVRISAIEFWQGGIGRVHQRVRYERTDDGWSSGWLNP